jgi:hypothetical protein
LRLCSSIAIVVVLLTANVAARADAPWMPPRNQEVAPRTVKYVGMSVTFTGIAAHATGLVLLLSTILQPPSATRDAGWALFGGGPALVLLGAPLWAAGVHRVNELRLHDARLAASPSGATLSCRF